MAPLVCTLLYLLACSPIDGHHRAKKVDYSPTSSLKSLPATSRKQPSLQNLMVSEWEDWDCPLPQYAATLLIPLFEY